MCTSTHTLLLPTMQKLTLILLLIFGFELYSQESDYRLISESDISVKYEKITDTVNIKKSRIALKWKILKPEVKEKIRTNIAEKKKDIKSDTTNLSKIYYVGKKENVELKINGRLLKPTVSLAKFQYISIYGDSIYKIDLGTISRYSKVKSAELILKDLKRRAELKIDSKYSLINIEVEHIRNLTDILEWERRFEENAKKIKESGKVPEIPDTIEVIEKEVVLIKHKIPKRKHSW